MSTKTLRNIFLGVFFTGFAADIFYFPGSSDLRYVFLLFIWWVCVYMFKLKSKITFILALIMVGLLFIFYVFSKESPTMERIASWVYLLSVFGIIQQFVEINGEKHTA